MKRLAVAFVALYFAPSAARWAAYRWEARR